MTATLENEQQYFTSFHVKAYKVTWGSIRSTYIYFSIKDSFSFTDKNILLNSNKINKIRELYQFFIKFIYTFFTIFHFTNLEGSRFEK